MSAPGGFRGFWIPALSCVVALGLSIWPLPRVLEPFWPAWLALVAMYWCMALPQRFGIAMCWSFGLLADALTGAVLGQHALALTLVAFATLKLYLRVRMYPTWQQSLVIGLILVIYQFVLYWLDGIIGQTPPLYWRLAPLPASILLWPWVFGLLRFIRRRYQLA